MFIIFLCVFILLCIAYIHITVLCLPYCILYCVLVFEVSVSKPAGAVEGQCSVRSSKTPHTALSYMEITAYC